MSRFHVGARLKRTYRRLQVARRGFWFVDIPRTSSTSIRIGLARHFGTTYGKRNVLERENATSQVFRDHIPAVEMREILGLRIWSRIFTFTMIRNPWDRAYSMYWYRRKKGKIPPELAFGEYLRALEAKDRRYFTYYGHWLGAVDYILDDEGTPLVDFVARYENRARDLETICSVVGIDTFGELALQRATPPDQHYSRYYDRESRDIVARVYRRDIETFHYAFEEPNSSHCETPP